MFIEELTNMDGVSGDETAVREFIKEQITPYADEIIVDSMGNLIALRRGNPEKKIMLAAHMDEVGFIISGVTEKGYLRFKTVGGIDTRVIISKRVRIGENKIKGVIGMKAIHLQKPSERDSVPEVKDLFIDIGAKSKEEALEKVNLGDYAAFDTNYEKLGDFTFKAKAIDDRIGCATLLDLIRTPVKYDTYFVFTVQEEVGLRGAGIAANRIKPDIALVLEATTCSDIAGFKEHEYVTSMGGGVAISFMDMRTVVDADFHRWLYKLAESNNIPVQYKRSASGGNDAGKIHLALGGIKTASISVPCRYLHSPCSIASLNDVKGMYVLARLFLYKIDEVI